MNEITNSYSTGLKILKKINELKIVKHSEKLSYISGKHQTVFMYSNNEERSKHETIMLAQGWYKLDTQDSIDIYSNSYKGDYLSVPCNIYEKDTDFILEY